MNSELTLRLVDNHRQFLSLLERRLGDRALAEDILQDAFVKSLQKEEDVRDETSSVAWFYRTLRNAVIDHYRRTGARNVFRAREVLRKQVRTSCGTCADHGCLQCSCGKARPPAAAAHH